MGRGNVCVTGKYEGLFYVDNDYLHLYERTGDGTPEMCHLGGLDYDELTSGEWRFNGWATDNEWRTTVSYLQARMTDEFPSFSECDEWIGRDDEHAILKNHLFYVVTQDNQWSMAVKLIERPDEWACENRDGLRKRHYQTYLNGIRDILFELFPTLGIYGGAWTSGTISRGDVAG